MVFLRNADTFFFSVAEFDLLGVLHSLLVTEEGVKPSAVHTIFHCVPGYSNCSM